MAKSQRLWPTLKRLLSYGKPWRKSLWLAVGMLWIAAAAEVTGPVLVSYFIDNLVAKHQMPWGDRHRAAGVLYFAATAGCGFALFPGAAVQPRGDWCGAAVTRGRDERGATSAA